MIQTIQKDSTSRLHLEWDARVQKAVSLSFLVTGLGTALILGLGTFLGY